jgi:hypothetical protein
MWYDRSAACLFTCPCWVYLSWKWHSQLYWRRMSVSVSCVTVRGKGKMETARGSKSLTLAPCTSAGSPSTWVDEAPSTAFVAGQRRRTGKETTHSASGVFLPPSPSRLPCPSYCDAAQARWYLRPVNTRIYWGMPAHMMPFLWGKFIFWGNLAQRLHFSIKYKEGKYSGCYFITRLRSRRT